MARGLDTTVAASHGPTTAPAARGRYNLWTILSRYSTRKWHWSDCRLCHNYVSKVHRNSVYFVCLMYSTTFWPSLLIISPSGQDLNPQRYQKILTNTFCRRILRIYVGH